MNTPKSTPGPWTAKPFLTPDAEDDPLGVYELNVREQLEKRYLDANDFEAGSAEEQAYLDKLHAENQANARIIASAPDLLAALTAIVNGSVRVSSKANDMLSEHDPKVIAARAAIAKATQ